MEQDTAGEKGAVTIFGRFLGRAIIFKEKLDGRYFGHPKFLFENRICFQKVKIIPAFRSKCDFKMIIFLAYTEIVGKYKDAQNQAQGQALFNQQKLTNLALMLETEYLARQNSLVDSVSKKLNYQVNYAPGVCKDGSYIL